MRTLRTFATGFALTALSGLLLAQDPNTGGWRRVDDPPPAAAPAEPTPAEPAPAPEAYPAPAAAAAPAPAPAPLDAYGNPQTAPAYRGAPAMPPAQLTIQPGTFITVRVNQVLSSDHNQPGDPFAATLAEPLVVDGVVVARRGQTVAGRVAAAEKAGRIKGTSSLGLELTELSLVDGQRVPMHTQLVSRSGGTSHGNDAGAIATTTGLGAVIGAAADWGRGAAIGAGAGAAAGIIGVLLTRGHATEVYPEAALTFRIEAPVVVSTERAPQAFQYVQQSDYDRSPSLRARPPVAVAAPPSLWYGPGWGPGWYGPGWYGPWGPGFYSGIYFGRGYYRGGRRW